jgi:hypothetical protein
MARVVIAAVVLAGRSTSEVVTRQPHGARAVFNLVLARLTGRC